MHSVFSLDIRCKRSIILSYVPGIEPAICTVHWMFQQYEKNCSKPSKPNMKKKSPAHCSNLNLQNSVFFSVKCFANLESLVYVTLLLLKIKQFVFKET